MTIRNVLHLHQFCGGRSFTYACGIEHFQSNHQAVKHVHGCGNSKSICYLLPHAYCSCRQVMYNPSGGPAPISMPEVGPYSAVAGVEGKFSEVAAEIVNPACRVRVVLHGDLGVRESTAQTSCRGVSTVEVASGSFRFLHLSDIFFYPSTEIGLETSRD